MNGAVANRGGIEPAWVKCVAPRPPAIGGYGCHDLA